MSVRLRGLKRTPKNCSKGSTNMDAQQDAKRAILDYIVAHPQETYASVGRKIGVSQATISRLALAAGINRKRIRPDLSKLTDEHQQ